jgi:hypothetical protein
MPKQTLRQQSAKKKIPPPKHAQWQMYVLNPKKKFPNKRVDRVKGRQLKERPVYDYEKGQWKYFGEFYEDELVLMEEAAQEESAVAEKNRMKRLKDKQKAKAKQTASLAAKKQKLDLVTTLRKKIQELESELKILKKENTRYLKQVVAKDKQIRKFKAEVKLLKTDDSSSDSSSDDEEEAENDKRQTKSILSYVTKLAKLEITLKDTKKKLQIEEAKTYKFKKLLEKSEADVKSLSGLKSNENALKEANKSIAFLKAKVEKLQNQNSENKLKIQQSKENETRLKEQGLLDRKKVEALAKVETAKIQYQQKLDLANNNAKNVNTRNVSQKFYGQSQIMGSQNLFNRSNHLSQMPLYGGQQGYTPQFMPQIPANGGWSPHLQQQAINTRNNELYGRNNNTRRIIANEIYAVGSSDGGTSSTSTTDTTDILQTP